MMHPNELFRYLYPALWSEYYSDQDLPKHELHIGMYALSLGIGYKTQLFSDRMVREALFSKETYSDSWYSELFRTHMSGDHNHRFRMEWLKACSDRGITKAWISIDGSNNDCEVTDSDLCEKGNAKSHTNSDIVSFIWALDIEAGMPITYFVNNGGMVDSKAFQEMAAFLSRAGIGIEGVILDRGFCTHDVFRMLGQCGYPYVVC